MSIICPTITAFSPHEYREQMELVSHFASRVHVDLMDGKFAPTKSPEISQIWLPEKLDCDVHVMYRDPLAIAEQLLALRPKLIIVQAEAEPGSVRAVIERFRGKVRIGISLLPATQPRDDAISVLIEQVDHVLIFSGNLGHHGGSVANLELLNKVAAIRDIKPDVEIGWDGGVSPENAAELSKGGIDVLNVGGSIHSSQNPQDMYQLLSRLV